METRKVKIIEKKDGWLIRDFSARQVRRTCKTAAGALNAIRRRGAQAARCGISTVYEVEWETTTDIGRAVVEALQ